MTRELDLVGFCMKYVPGTIFFAARSEMYMWRPLMDVVTRSFAATAVVGTCLAAFGKETKTS